MIKSLYGKLRSESSWFHDIKRNALAGMTTTLALIPDALAFSLIAGVPPTVGIYSTVWMLLVTSFFCGRPGMVSSSAGSLAVLMTALVARHGLPYLFAATVLTGVIQLLMGLLKMGSWMRFVSPAVVSGFVNALAILIFLAQLNNFAGAGWEMYAGVGVTLLIIYVLPKFTKAVPSPLIAVAALPVVIAAFGLPFDTVGDSAVISSHFPMFSIPDVPMNLDTLLLVLPFSLSIALVGYAETLLTQTLIDDVTGVRTNKNKEMRAQGAANVVSGLFGGMAGCALVAESILNVKMGGRGRLSTLTAALFLLVLAMVFGHALSAIPIASLTGVMFMVCFAIVDWSFLKNMRGLPFQESVAMLATLAVSLLTHNLAIGMLAGVLASVFFFLWKMSHLRVHKRSAGNKTVYKVHGPLFFVNAADLAEAIDDHHDSTHIEMDLTEAKLWDHSARQVLQQITDKLQQRGKVVNVVQLED